MHHVIEASVFVHACIPRIAIRSTTTSGEDSPVQSIMRMHVYAAYAAIYIYIVRYIFALQDCRKLLLEIIAWSFRCLGAVRCNDMHVRFYIHAVECTCTHVYRSTLAEEMAAGLRQILSDLRGPKVLSGR